MFKRNNIPGPASRTVNQILNNCNVFCMQNARFDLQYVDWLLFFAQNSKHFFMRVSNWPCVSYCYYYSIRKTLGLVQPGFFGQTNKQRHILLANYYVSIVSKSSTSFAPVLFCLFVYQQGFVVHCGHEFAMAYNNNGQ